MERDFPRDMASLNAIFRFVDSFLAAEKINASNAFAIYLIFEELFTNTVKYARGDRDIRISIDRDKDLLILSLTDFDVESFDITKAQEVDVNKPIKERTPGRLGIHFVRQLAEDLVYDYKDRNSKITLTKRLET